MALQKLESVDAFVFTDLEGASRAVGVVRSAPKILVGGARLLARSLSYQFATFEQQIAGASAGINAAPDERADAVDAFVAEVRPQVESGALVLDAAKGVAPGTLDALHAVDGRPSFFAEHVDELRAAGVVAVADAAVDGLDGRTVAIEGFDAAGSALAAAVADRGGRVVALSTPEGSTFDASGLEPAALASAWAEVGIGLVDEMGRLGTPEAVFGAEADVLLVGSKAGVVDHDVAAGIGARALVPSGPAPVTAKALAVLGRADVVVVPDFVSTAAPELARRAEAEASVESVRSDAVAALVAVTGEIVGHDEGPYLGGCRRAEAFLGTWQEQLPFGRPLA